MKIYAKQVPPEYQESPLYLFDEWPENVFVFGNRHYNQHDEYLQTVRRGLEEAASAWDYMQEGRPFYTSWSAALNDLLTPWEDRGQYTRTERGKWAEICRRYCECKSHEENHILCEALELISGEKWETATISGCCQGDWQEIIYPAIYGPEWLRIFETEYFNTGTEWTVDPDGDNYSIYVTGWSDDDARREIADAAGVDPSDVVLLKFTGWSRSASYEEVSA